MMPDGATLRDWSAVHAVGLPSWEKSGGPSTDPADDVAGRAYELADALLMEGAKNSRR